MKKICVITGTRAEYGLLRKLIELLEASESLECQLVVTGTHLEEHFGMTVKEIEEDGKVIDYRIPILEVEDSPTSTAIAMGKALVGFSNAFVELEPDLLVVLGDRFEILSAAVAAQLHKIPVAHIHGGESTEGLIDEAFRHSITKMSQIHFVANEIYRKRVIQLGEDPKSVFNVGGMGVDAISNFSAYSREELQNLLDIKFLSKNLIITHHPVTLEKDPGGREMTSLLEALSSLEDTTLLFTMPNSDPGHNVLVEHIKKFVSENKNAYFFPSLGERVYYSCLRQIDGVVGNSSSGLIEVPTFKKGTINIGTRQKGRIKASSVIDCEADADAIRNAVAKLYSLAFQEELTDVVNPYGEPGAPARIVEAIERMNLKNMMSKKFFDVEIT